MASFLLHVYAFTAATQMNACNSDLYIVVCHFQGGLRVMRWHEDMWRGYMRSSHAALKPPTFRTQSTFIRTDTIPKIGDRFQTLNFETVRFSSSHHKSQEKFIFQSVMIFRKNYFETCRVTWPPHWRLATFWTSKISASPMII